MKNINYSSLDANVNVMYLRLQEAQIRVSWRGGGHGKVEHSRVNRSRAGSGHGELHPLPRRLAAESSEPWEEQCNHNDQIYNPVCLRYMRGSNCSPQSMLRARRPYPRYSNGMNLPVSPISVVLSNCSFVSQLTSVYDDARADAAACPRYRAKLYHCGVQTGIPVPRATEIPLAPSKYWAPETVSSIGSQPSMDIYSMGQILSDLWYGCEYRAFKLPKDSTAKRDWLELSTDEDRTDSLVSPSPTAMMQLEEGFSRSRSRSVHPGHGQGKISPLPQLYQQLIIDCCDVVAERRPCVQYVSGQLQEIAKNTRRTATQP